MRSQILVRDAVPNAERKFGSGLVYYPALVHLEFATHRALFTENQILEAIERADKNREDWPKPVPRLGWWKRFVNWWAS